MTRTVVVTGSVSGIGKATAEILAKNGARVTSTDRQTLEERVWIGA